MRAVAEERIENTSEAFARHIDRCLGCRACEQACPAGVQYGQLLEASREELLEAQPKQDWMNRSLRFALRHIWSSPARLRLMFGAARVFRDLGLARLLLKLGVMRFPMALLESSRPIFKEAVDPIQTDGDSVLLFKGCVGEGLFARVNRATRRVLQANGFKVEAPESQVCCGALHAHAGDLDGARKLARKNLAAFGKTDAPIVTNAGGCGAMLTTYGHLLANDAAVAEQARQFSARVRDVSQQLATHEMRSGESPVTNHVTCDLSCHLLYGQRAGETSLKTLQRIEELNFVPLTGAERCCGAAGIYNMLQPELSRQVLNEKLDHVKATGASILATGNAGCQMQIGAGAMLAGMDLQVCHPIELVDQSYARAGFYDDGKQNA
jgi:glycolate dehydrogenase iron-sulfur subunit